MLGGFLEGVGFLERGNLYQIVTMLATVTATRAARKVDSQFEIFRPAVAGSRDAK
jgi:hypothetical protein